MNSEPLPDEQELWRPVVGHEKNYLVSNFGNVRSKLSIILDQYGQPRRLKSRFLKLSNCNGYKRCNLAVDCDVISQELVHRLVARAWLDTPELPEVNHLDLNKSNNYFKNLEWCTRKQNAEHAALMGRFSAKTNPNCIRKLTNEKVAELKHQFFFQKKSILELCITFELSEKTVRDILNNKVWSLHE